MHLKLHQIKALVAVVRCGSIRSAARSLHVSPTALTKSFRTLEEETGEKVLMRSAEGVQLTHLGQRLAMRAGTILRQLELAEQELRADSGDAEGTLRVALSPLLPAAQLRSALYTFRQRYPRITLEMFDGVADKILPWLRDSTADIAIVGRLGTALEDKFHVRPLFESSGAIMVRKGHPVCAKPSVGALAALDWMLPSALHAGAGNAVQQMFSNAGLPPPTFSASYDSINALVMLQASDLATVVPKVWLGKEHTKELVALDVPELVPGPIQIALLTTEAPLSGPMQHFSDCVEVVCGPQRREQPLLNELIA